MSPTFEDKQILKECEDARHELEETLSYLGADQEADTCFEVTEEQLNKQDGKHIDQTN